MLRYAIPIIFLLTQELEPRKTKRSTPPVAVGPQTQQVYQVRRDQPKMPEISPTSAALSR